jgi:hypothetical protein
MCQFGKRSRLVTLLKKKKRATTCITEILCFYLTDNKGQTFVKSSIRSTGIPSFLQFSIPEVFRGSFVGRIDFAAVCRHAVIHSVKE